MKTSISSKADSLQVIYDNYRKGLFIVNRRYQRKLVWTREEKMAFLDSIYNKFSVPLILLANIQNDDQQQYEIIDGLQRLNAICSFVENEFGIMYNEKESYFDLQTLASTKELLDSGKIEQQTPILPRDICMEMMSSYQVPISYVTADSKNVEEIFRRINSFGRQLSPQEIRQAGSLGLFPDIVRRLSAEIRGDVSDSEQVELGKMKNISLSNKRLKYGITLDDVFWVKHNIIPDYNMRISRDEEIVAYILAYMILGSKYCTTAKSLTKLYQSGLILTTDGIDVPIDNYIAKYGQDALRRHFVQTFEELRKILEEYGKGFRRLLYNDGEGEHIFLCFQIVYLAFYELLFKESMVIQDKQKLINGLTGIGNTIFKEIGKPNWNVETREKYIHAVEGVIRDAFKKRTGEDVAFEDWQFQFESILHKSTIEGTQYDYKLGLHELSDQEGDIEKVVHKYVKILTAEVNKAPLTSGYVIVGIAEGDKSLQRHQSFYGYTEVIAPFPSTDFYIVGLDKEIQKYYSGKTDLFIREIKKHINTSPIEENVKAYILTNLKLITYQGKQVLILELKSDTDAIAFDKEYYERRGNDTEKVDNGEKMKALLKRFL